MMTMKTPGVYIDEINAFSSSVLAVATAVPAFVGYTEKADNSGKSLSLQPWPIRSMAEFVQYFGAGPAPQFSLAKVSAASATPASSATSAALSLLNADYLLTQVQGRYLLHASLQLFFQNGGGTCYIVSVGSYSDAAADALMTGVDQLVNVREPTLLVIPDAMLLAAADGIRVAQHMLQHCGDVMKNRMAILDVADGYRSRQDPAGDPISAFRNALGDNSLDYGVAYYPWLHTNITTPQHLGYWQLDATGQATLQSLLITELNPAAQAGQIQTLIDGITQTGASPQAQTALSQSLMALSPVYSSILTQMAAILNLLPPAAALAGVYTTVDNNSGVWQAPANVSLNAVTSPSVLLNDAEQGDLNVTPQGKSIDAIRVFPNLGIMVWGARTLDGNSQDWRFISVRRTMIMLEESIRQALQSYVFAANDGATWAAVTRMISNFLTGIWQQGGLVGATPADAFAVSCGLGQTMTGQDIQDGLLIVTVMVALIHPAEFMVFTLEQQMATA
ncbi:MAG: Uncharacterized protein FD135_571 [Comamonadaceae bacterium]|nr:MAG: Uncharacterized protein FD135_571 [Comamonadaceae bacterium]